MPPRTVTHTLGHAIERVPGLRWVPVVKLVAAAEIALIAHDHLGRLTPPERRRLLVLVRTGRGRRSRLTGAQRTELERLLVKLAPRQFMGETVDRLSPLHLPNRLLYGRRSKP